MSSTYSEPVSTADVLYLEHYGNPNSFGTLAQRITDHFGPDVKLSQFDIEPERLQVRGCMCCNDSSDYEIYLVITRRTDLCESTADQLMSSLTIS
jgi:hypothetical protein